MGEPTNGGTEHSDPYPERDRDEVQDQAPDIALGDPTARIWAEPTTAIISAPTPPAATHPQSDQPPGHPQITPPAAPPVGNPYAQQQPPAAYGQQPPPSPDAQQLPPSPYGQAQSAQHYYAAGQKNQANGSAIVLTIVSGVSLLFCNVFALGSLILGIVALTRNTTDHQGSRRLTKIGWIVFASVWVVAILALVGFIVLGVASSHTSSTQMFGN